MCNNYCIFCFIVILYIKIAKYGAEMTEDELLLAVLDDKTAECEDKYIVTNTGFLDIYRQSTVIEYLKRKNVRYELYGGFKDSERKLAVFLPEYAESVDYLTENPDASPICVLVIKKDGFSELSHRDYLGAIMGLGVKREMLGDIAVTDGGCAVAVMKSVAKYIGDNLTSVGRGTVSVCISDDFSKFEKEEKFEFKRCYVSSMRVDAVLAAAFSLSRGTALEKIRRGEVFLNSVEVTKPDMHVPFSSKLVIHGKGKVLIYEDDGVTKKGRQAFVIKKFL